MSSRKSERKLRDKMTVKEDRMTKQKRKGTVHRGKTQNQKKEERLRAIHHSQKPLLRGICEGIMRSKNVMPWKRFL